MINEAELRQNLAADNVFFKRVLDLIPPHFYFDNQRKAEQDEEGEPEAEQKNAGKAGKRPADPISNKQKWKIAKYDPAQMKTVSERMQLGDKDVDEDDASEPQGKRKKKTLKKVMDSNGSADSPEELQDRLRMKLDSLRAKRNALGKEDGVEKKKMKRRESKLKLKARKKVEKQKTHSKSIDREDSDKVKKPKSPPKPIYNKEGKMVFSKFDFTQVDTKQKEDQTSSKNYKKLLEKANREKEKIDKLKEEDSVKAQTVIEKTAWKLAMQKAEGVKVRDNVDMLKKAQKRKDGIKKKHKKEWKERSDKIEDKKQEKQDKRTKNIKKQKQKNVDHKIKKAKKKGRIIPGF